MTRSYAKYGIGLSIPFLVSSYCLQCNAFFVGRHCSNFVSLVPSRISEGHTVAAESFYNAQSWDADRYQSQHSFVWKYGSSLVQDLLNAQKGEKILDVGCGTGELTAQVSSMRDSNLEVIGIDSDPNMIASAKKQFPSVTFFVADVRSLTSNAKIQEAGKFDAIFSNAALHWVPEAELAVASLSACLKPGGRFVAELGGKGNIKELSSFLERQMNFYSPRKRNFPWYFPSISEYSNILERNGLEVVFAQLYDRPTPLQGEKGLRNWILMFGNSFLDGLSSEQKELIIQKAEEELKPKLYKENGWVADYRRIRIVAKKTVISPPDRRDVNCE